MRAVATRVWDTLCAGRAPRDVAWRLATAFGLAGLAWTVLCAFLLLEPVA